MSQAAVEFVAPARADLEHIARHLRDQDQEELRAAGHDDFLRVLLTSVERTAWAAVARADGEPVCVFGCAEHGPAMCPDGVPWFLGTAGVIEQRRALQRYAPRYIAAMLRSYPRLLNVVHAENTVAVRWLQRLGFTLHPPHKNPATGASFHLFEMHRNV